MAIRYSGDIEVRISVIRTKGTRVFHASFRNLSLRGMARPGIRARAVLSFSEVGIPPRAALSSAAYDRTAKAFFELAKRHERRLDLEMDEDGAIVVRRVFQSPCPV
jgi:hypothetical protein